MEYEQIKQQIFSMLPVPKEFDDQQNLLSLGLNSLKIMRLVNAWRKNGIKVSYGSLLEDPTLQAWVTLIETAQKKRVSTSEQPCALAKVNASFPLTDVQYAYKIGREDGRELGGVGCHAYMEFEGAQIDFEKLNAAWKTVQLHHPMLRARFLENGEQEILEKPYQEQIAFYDFSHDCDYAEKVAQLAQELSHRKFEVEKGHVCAITLALLPNGTYRLFYDVDLLVADVQSFHIIFRDLATAYAGKPLPPDSKNWSFASYLEQKQRCEAEEMKAAKEYWKQRLETMPFGPELPLAKAPAAIKQTKTTRRTVTIPIQEWEVVMRKAAEINVTPAVYLMAVYALIIGSRSVNKRFLLNVPLFDRHIEYGANEDAVADFTTLLLLEVDLSQNPTFAELLLQISRRLHEDLKYTCYSGVQVQRDMMHKYGGAEHIAPVVFACNFGNPLISEEFEQVFGVFRQMLSQTPGVWIDFQSYEMQDNILLTWDCVDELFPQGLLDDMMTSMRKLIQDTAEQDWARHFDLLPPAQRAFVEKQKQIEPVTSKERLFDGFLASAENYADKVAVIDTETGQQITYAKLKQQALCVANYFVKQNIRGQAVAVTLPRGSLQVIAALGILLSGNCYVPVGIHQPPQRRKAIHELVSIAYAICSHTVSSKIQWPETVAALSIETLLEEAPLVQLPEISAEEPAYIIMTSGTTGAPKGVQICHKGAVNTINDVNSRYGILPTDSVLGVSALDFDLSVYDLFGTFCAGATLVTIPEEKSRDAEFWLEQVVKHRITVWNSVPTLLEMLLVCAQAEHAMLPFRVIMLSGDWIALDLPERAASLTQNCKLISMGGATEASIWSNFFEILLPIPKQWHSIPYGRPLAGQSYRIVDDFGADVPFWCEGELWIGGVGVGTYRGDSELTRQKFVTEYGTTWYKTGDKGRFWQDGTIEFLGRKDFQVKVRGHRIELGETESALRQIESVAAAVAEVAEGAKREKHLVAFLETGMQRTAPLFQTDAEILSAVNRICQAISGLGKETFSDQAYYKTISFANQTVCKLLLALFQNTGIFADQQEYTQQEVLVALQVLPEYMPVVQRYLELLVQNKILSCCGANGYCLVQALPAIPQPCNDTAANIAVYLEQLAPWIGGILQGTNDPVTVFYGQEQQLSPAVLFNLLPGTQEITEAFAQKLRHLCKAFDKKVRIAEVGTRNLAVTTRLLQAVAGDAAAYTYLDASAYFTNEAAKLKAEYPFFTVETFDFEQDWCDTSEFDIIIAANFLHRTKNMERTIKNLYQALSPSGVVCILEITERNALQDVTAALLEKGTVQIMPLSVYRSLLEQSGFDQIFELFETDGFGSNALFAAATNKATVLNQDYLVQQLSDRLPDYMIPKVFYALETFPLSRNGKIDRKRLRLLAANEPETAQTAPTTETEQILCKIWCELFGIEQIGIDDNYYRLGGDSLTAIKMTTLIKQAFPVAYSIKDAMNDHTISQQANTIKKRMQTENEANVQAMQTITPDPEHAHVPFPLTDVQNAYFLGRSSAFSLSGVSTHCYFELDGKALDLAKANAALNDLIRYHGAARLVIHANGTQEILEQVPEYQMQVYRLEGLDETVRKEALLRIREELSHQIIDIETWPLFDIRVAVLEDGVKIFVSFDNIVFDGFSMFQILNEWAERYKGTYREKPPLALSFRDYVLGVEQMKASEKYQQDRAYWLERLDDFLPAPALPVQKRENELTEQKFQRHTAYLSAMQWSCLKEAAKAFEITPSVLLLTAYAEVLRTRSANAEFTLNLTQFDRKELHEQVSCLLGDFTTLTLLEIKNANEDSFIQRAKKVGSQLAEDLAHSDYSAVDFQRELRRRTQNNKNAVMPVVFTSGLGISKWAGENWLGELTYNISQTPQVWLDHQVIETNGGLGLFWDSLADLFYPGFIDEMFDDYVRLLTRLAEDRSLFTQKIHSLVEVKINKAREDANQTQVDFSDQTLDGMFLKAAETYPNRIALVSNNQMLTYQELKQKALRVCALLQQKQIQPQEPVAIFAPKGIEQVVAALGILLAGGAYLPLDFENPQERIATILKDSGASKVIVREIPQSPHVLDAYDCITACGESDVPERMVHIPEKATNSLCYVIYTSGSTGTPKGVMISHAGAANTIQDINWRFGINETDACLAISNLNFDLSVYDIFGLLAAGGKVVIPDAEETREPKRWAELIAKEQITIWNSVPAFAEMFCAYHGASDLTNQQSLRLMLLSGDWIHTDLPPKLYRMFGQLRLVALGGATEASIWSNFFEVPHKIPKEWSSVPYGKPLGNQKYYILDAFLQNRPNWVPGTIFIAGKGVALGYFQNPEQTSRQFITHPVTGEYMYNTGDCGRYWNDGTIEFLGRQDNQIKINGYRVEIGEIEAVLNRINGVSSSKVLYKDEVLIAFFQAHSCDAAAIEHTVKAALAQALPAYMVPQKLIPIEQYPLTSNGKIDFAKLYQISQTYQSAQQTNNKRQPETELEIALSEIWGGILNYAPVYAEDDFFTKGGDSLKAIYLVNAIQSKLGITIAVKEIYTNSMLSSLAAQLQQQTTPKNSFEEAFEI